MCGVGGIWGEEAVERAEEMARWLMHRGEEGVGYAFLTEEGITFRPSRGAVAALVHTRYSTTGPYGVQIQPVLAKYRDFEAAVAFNGTIANYASLVPGSQNDAEALAKKFAELVWECGLAEGLARLYHMVEGAASIVALTHEGLIAVRDLRGIRPLYISANAAASETIALEGDAKEIPPGYAVVIGPNSRWVKYGDGASYFCALECVYFSHPASKHGGVLVGEMRRRLGQLLAEVEDREIDVVTYVPETAELAARGYAEALGKPLVEAVVKNRYAGRIFIKPPYMRAPRTAFKIVPDLVRGRRVAVVDDSLIRGTNLAALTKALREAGAAEVHLRIASPPVKWPCYYGMDFQNPAELLAAGRGEEEIAEILGVDSLRYLPMDKFRYALGPNICYACFDGRYPVRISAALGRNIAVKL